MAAEKVFPRRPFSPRLDRLADGVWVLKGDLRGSMNVYLLEDEGGVTMFDAGTKPMTKGVLAAAARLGGLKRVVLGHSHVDHRGTAPFLDVPVLCHPDEVADAEGDGGQGYQDFAQVTVARVRLIYPALYRRWDGGPVKISGTVSEGDEVAGFTAVHFPGHAPGQIGLWRESDRLALVSDTIYLIDSQRLKPLPDGEAMVPWRAFNKDTEQARVSVRKLAALNPATVAPGHSGPLTGDLVETLERAAEA